MKLRIIGDIHGNVGWYTKRILDAEREEMDSIQLGDLGIGFLTSLGGDILRSGQENARYLHRFIRGNHDNPYMCSETPYYMGDYGYDEKTGVFFVSGANSIDKDCRVPGVDWWPNEELSFHQMDDCLALYTKIKPRYVVSHEAPLSVVQKKLEPRPIRMNNTTLFLQSLLDTWSPESWWYGHHHRSTEHMISGTRFVCVGECNYVDEYLYQ